MDRSSERPSHSHNEPTSDQGRPARPSSTGRNKQSRGPKNKHTKQDQQKQNEQNDSKQGSQDQDNQKQSNRKRGKQGQNKGRGKATAGEKRGDSKKKPKSDTWHPDKKSALRENRVRAGKLFCKGVDPTHIPDVLREKYGIEVGKKTGWRLVKAAAREGWLHCDPPSDLSMSRRIRQHYLWLQDVDVVPTSYTEDVSDAAANMVFHLIRQVNFQHQEEKASMQAQPRAEPPAGEAKPKAKRRNNRPQAAVQTLQDQLDGVHLGVAPGYTISRMMKRLSRKITDTYNGEGSPDVDGMPECLHLHSMAAGFDPFEHSVDPNSMFAWFDFDPTVQLKTRSVSLLAPPVVTAEQFESLKRSEGVKEAFARRDDIDIVVTSLGLWEDEHCMLRRYMKRNERAARKLEMAGVLGDMMWRPISDKPITLETDIRAMTLMELDELNGLIQRDGKVVLLCGPCMCGMTKTPILKRILDQRKRLITHLTLDSKTAYELVKMIDAENQKRDD